MVCKLDRLGRSLQDQIQIVNDLAGRGVGFHHCPETLGVGQVSTWCIAALGRKQLYAALKYWLDERPLSGGKQLLHFEAQAVITDSKTSQYPTYNAARIR